LTKQEKPWTVFGEMRTHYYGNKDQSKFHVIPIFDFILEVVVCHDIKRAHDTHKRLKRLGGQKLEEEYGGLCCYCGRQMVLFFQRDQMTHNLIAHEIRHAVDAILHFNNVNFEGDGMRETPALLSGYITYLVHQDLKNWKIKLRR